MLIPTTVDALQVVVIVDNVTDSLSTNPPGVTSEFRWLMSGGRMNMAGGANICCAHHGLSLLISAAVGGRTSTLLFDAGPEAATFRRNCAILGIDFAAVSDIVLSHGHWDHAGGLAAAVAEVARARGRANVNCYVHPGMFVQRGTTLPSGLVFPMEPVATPEELAACGATVLNTGEPQLVARRADARDRTPRERTSQATAPPSRLNGGASCGVRARGCFRPAADLACVMGRKPMESPEPPKRVARDKRRSALLCM